MQVEAIGQEGLAAALAWASEQGFDLAGGASLLPDSGFWVPGVAAGWVYLTNSKLALLEPIVANPGCDKIERSKALDLLVHALLAFARDNGAVTMMALSQHPAIEARALRLGFGKAAGPFHIYLKGLE